MICKWCGAAAEPAERTCRSCGRELAPLSDCGGFYDLVDTRGRGNAPQPGPVPVKVDLLPLQEELRRGAARNTKQMNRLHLTTLLCAGVMLILVVLLMVQVLALGGQVARLEETVEAYRRELRQEPNHAPGISTETSGPADSTGEEPKDYAGEELEVLVVYDAAQEEPLMDLGALEGVLEAGPMEPEQDESPETGGVEGNPYSLRLTGEAGPVLKMILVKPVQEQGAEAVYVLEWLEMDAAFFGEEDIMTVTWEYQTEDTGEWVEFPQNPEGNQKELRYDAALAEYQNSKIRCVVRRSSLSGGSLTIHMEITNTNQEETA